MNLYVIETPPAAGRSGFRSDRKHAHSGAMQVVPHFVRRHVPKARSSATPFGWASSHRARHSTSAMAHARSQAETIAHSGLRMQVAASSQQLVAPHAPHEESPNAYPPHETPHSRPQRTAPQL